MSNANNSRISTEWPVTPDLDAQVEQLGVAYEHVGDQMWLPDKREMPAWHYALASLAMGGRHGSVLAMGLPGGGKTLFGDVVLGAKNRVEVTSQDTLETLVEGYLRPTDGGFNPGRIDLTDNILFLNEIAHLGDNPEALNALFESIVRSNQKLVPSDNISYYSAGNHPSLESKRSRPLDPALRSRHSMSLEVSFTSEQAAERYQRMMIDELARLNRESLLAAGNAGIATTSERDMTGVIPGIKARRALAIAAMQGFKKLRRDNGAYIQNLDIALNQTGLFNTIDYGDGRSAQSFLHILAAQRLADLAIPDEDKASRSLIQDDKSRKHETDLDPAIVTPYQLSTIASLRLGHIATIRGDVAQSLKREITGNGRHLSESEVSMLGRKVIAAVAYAVALEMDALNDADLPEKEREIRARANRYSYVNPEDSVSEAMDEKAVKTAIDKIDSRHFVK